MFNSIQHSIGKEKAIELYNSGWWEGKSHEEIAQFQLFTVELTVPFEIFHEAVEKCLGRPVFTHEFSLNYDGIVEEFLGQKPAPTLEEVIDLIPAEKRILIQM